jgi:hypothetical protein
MTITLLVNHTPAPDIIIPEFGYLCNIFLHFTLIPALFSTLKSLNLEIRRRAGGVKFMVARVHSRRDLINFWVPAASCKGV